MANKILSETLTPQQLKALRSKGFIERNFIIQNKLNAQIKARRKK